MNKKYPQIAVDGIILEKGKILLVKRKFNPFAGFWALPGGFVNYNESCETAITREVFEETALQIEPLGFFGVYSKPSRDPRGHVISIVFECFLKKGKIRKGDEALEVKFFSLEKLPTLAFDHKEIISDFKTFIQGEE